MYRFVSHFFLILLLVTSSRAIGQQAALVTVDAVVEQQFTQTVPILGRLTARQSGNVASRISGAVAEIHAQIGDRVSAGQILVKIDTATLTLREKQARSQLAEAETRRTTAKAQLALATQEVKRLEGLQGSAAVSQANYDDARQNRNIAIARVTEADANINSSQSSLDIAQLELGYAEIRAPFDGTITEKLTEVGSFLQTGQSVFRIISDQDLELEADVPAALLGGLAPGTPVQLILENNSRHSATVRAIIPEENPRTRTRRVRFTTELGSDSGSLASEQSATVFVPASASRQILSVHKDGVIRRGADNFVYVVIEDKAELRKIISGDSVDDRIEVISGLNTDELVVVRGNERLAPGQAVQLSEAQ